MDFLVVMLCEECESGEMKCSPRFASPKFLTKLHQCESCGQVRFYKFAYPYICTTEDDMTAILEEIEQTHGKKEN